LQKEYYKTLVEKTAPKYQLKDTSDYEAASKFLKCGVVQWR